MINRISLSAHPASVGETYLEHMGVAFSFAGRMALGAMACFVHGLLPFLFTRTGSGTINLLHERMVTNRHRHTPAPAAAKLT
jgi:hypothetical protein